MQLPQDLQHFSEPTLIVLADHVQAKFWLAGGDAIEALDGIAAPHELKSDNEGSFVNTDHGGSAGASEPHHDERLHHLVHLIVERIEQLVEKHEAARVVLVMNQELAHAVDGHLPKNITAHVAKEVHKDLMKDGILDVLKRLRKK